MANIQKRLDREKTTREELYAILNEIDASVIPLKKPYKDELFLCSRRIANLEYLKRKESNNK